MVVFPFASVVLLVVPIHALSVRCVPSSNWSGSQLSVMPETVRLSLSALRSLCFLGTSPNRTLSLGRVLELTSKVLLNVPSSWA